MGNRYLDIFVSAQGVITIDDVWTDEAIEADPAGFEEAILTALPDQLESMEFEVDDAYPRETVGV